MAMREYLATEVALDHADGLLTRREALRKLGLLGLTAAAASGLLAACSSEAPPAPSAAPPPAASPAPPAPAADPGYDVVAATARTEAVTFPGGAGEMTGAYAAPDGQPQGAVLVVHENRGLTDHIRAVTGRFAGDGYAALAPDLLSRGGGTAAVAEPMAVLSETPEADLVADLRSGIAELVRRHPGTPIAAVGFCFGGGMVWRLLDAGTPELAAAVPFYGPSPEGPTFDGTQAAVLGVFAEQDARVNAGIGTLETALSGAGVTHEMVIVPGVDHAFFNDTGARFNAPAATEIYQRVMGWFNQYLV